MMKSYLLLFLSVFALSTAFSQNPDSVLLNGEWRYIYPIDEPISFRNDYYYTFDLNQEEFDVWVEWKQVKDPRANLKLEALKDSIQYERFRRKEDADSIRYPYKKVKNVFRYHRFTARVQKKHPELSYSIPCSNLSTVPPVVADLPNGKYVQYYQPYATIGKLSKAQIIDQQVACLFELNNNDLHNDFVRLEPNGTILAKGEFDHAFKTGVWLATESKSYSFYPKHFYSLHKKFHEASNYTVANYNEGILNGAYRIYRNDELTQTGNYSSGQKTGIVTKLNFQDSIVYDVVRTFDRRLHKYETPNMDGLNRLLYDFPREKMEALPKNLNLNRWRYDFVTELSGLEFPEYRNPGDSLYMDSVFNRHEDYYYREYPLFESHFRLYDRDTKQLMMERTIDTVNGTWYGANWYVTGELFDTLWTVKDEHGIHNKIYDIRGNELYDSDKAEEIKKKELVSIDGFEAEKHIVRGKAYYLLSERTVRNDTTYTRIFWNGDKMLIESNYFIERDSIWGSTFGYPDHSVKTIEIAHGNFKEVYANGNLLVTLEKLADEKMKSSILLSGVPFHGTIQAKSGDKFTLRLRDGEIPLLEIGGISSYYGNYTEDYSGADPGMFFYQVIQADLKLDDEFPHLESLSGTLYNNQFVGPVKVKSKETICKDLNYVDGLANGSISLYIDRHNNYYSPVWSDYSAHNYIGGSGTNFKKAHIRKKFLFKTYQVKDGLKEGPMIFYSRKKDTVGCIPFSKGLKQGKAFQYSAYNLLKVEFDQDHLVGDFSLQTEEYQMYETILSGSLDRSGNLIAASSKKFVNERLEQYTQHTQLIPMGPRLEDGVKLVVTNNEELKLEAIVKDQLYKEAKFYDGDLQFSMVYSDSFPIYNDIRLLNLIQFIDHDEYGLSVLQNAKSRYPNYVRLEQYTLYSSNDYDRLERNRIGTFTKFNPNGNVARTGNFIGGEYSYRPKKDGLWKTYNFDGYLIHEIVYHDSVVNYNKRLWPVIGVQTEFGTEGNVIGERYLLEETEMYECASNDYYTERQFLAILPNSSPAKSNGWVKNYYDNGSLMNEGKMSNGLPEGLWKFYALDGKLNRLGSYVAGKQNGKWLKGDLSEKAYIGDICIDPDAPDYEFIIHRLENDKDIEVSVYKNGMVVNRNDFSEPEEIQLRF